MLISLILLTRIRTSSTYLRYTGGFFFNAIRYFIFEVGHVEFTEDRAQGRTHRYAICLNLNITNMVITWNLVHVRSSF